MSTHIIQKWTGQEIDSLKEMYRKGFREKEIARELDRPVCSVSKKIDILGLRQYGQERKIARQKYRQKQNKKPSAFAPHFLKIAEDDFLENDFFNIGGVHSVDEEVIDPQVKSALVDTMIYELRKNGINVTKTNKLVVKNDPKWKSHTFYLYKGIPITDGQLLLRYNMMREEKKQSLLLAPQLLSQKGSA